MTWIDRYTPKYSDHKPFQHHKQNDGFRLQNNSKRTPREPFQTHHSQKTEAEEVWIKQEPHQDNAIQTENEPAVSHFSYGITGDSKSDVMTSFVKTEPGLFPEPLPSVGPLALTTTTIKLKGEGGRRFNCEVCWFEAKSLWGLFEHQTVVRWHGEFANVLHDLRKGSGYVCNAKGSERVTCTEGELTLTDLFTHQIEQGHGDLWRVANKHWEKAEKNSFIKEEAQGSQELNAVTIGSQLPPGPAGFYCPGNNCNRKFRRIWALICHQKDRKHGIFFETLLRNRFSAAQDDENSKKYLCDGLGCNSSEGPFALEQYWEHQREMRHGCLWRVALEQWRNTGLNRNWFEGENAPGNLAGQERQHGERDQGDIVRSDRPQPQLNVSASWEFLPDEWNLPDETFYERDHVVPRNSIGSILGSIDPPAPGHQNRKDNGSERFQSSDISMRSQTNVKREEGRVRAEASTSQRQKRLASQVFTDSTQPPCSGSPSKRLTTGTAVQLSLRRPGETGSGAFGRYSSLGVHRRTPSTNNSSNYPVNNICQRSSLPGASATPRSALPLRTPATTRILGDAHSANPSSGTPRPNAISSPMILEPRPSDINSPYFVLASYRRSYQCTCPGKRPYARQHHYRRHLQKEHPQLYHQLACGERELISNSRRITYQCLRCPICTVFWDKIQLHVRDIHGGRGDRQEVFWRDDTIDASTDEEGEEIEDEGSDDNKEGGDDYRIPYEEDIQVNNRDCNYYEDEELKNDCLKIEMNTTKINVAREDRTGRGVRPRVLGEERNSSQRGCQWERRISDSSGSKRARLS